MLFRPTHQPLAVAGACCCRPGRLRRIRFHDSSGGHSSCLSTKHQAGRRISCGDLCWRAPWNPMDHQRFPLGMKQGNGISQYIPHFDSCCLMNLKFCLFSAVLESIKFIGFMWYAKMTPRSAMPWACNDSCWVLSSIHVYSQVLSSDLSV